MAWVTPPTFTAGQTAGVSTGLNQMSGDLAVIGGARSSSWVPTWTNLVVNNGILTTRYRQVDKEVDFWLQLTVGSTTAFSGGISFTLPATAAFQGTPFIGSGLDVSVSTTIGNPILGELTSTTTCGLRTWPTTAGNPLIVVRDTQPFTWAVGDILTISGRYEAA